MTNRNKFLGVASVIALFACNAGPAFAAGTLQGTNIVNTATVNFTVGGVVQTAQTASNTIVVDRRVNLVVANVGATTSVSPNQTNAVTSWTLTNSSNDTLDFALSATAQANGQTGQHGTTTAFVPSLTNVKYYLDPGNTGLVAGPGVTQVTYLDEIAPDAIVRLLVVADIPASATNAQVGGIILTGTAEAGGTSGTQGAVFTCANGSANTAGVDTICADGAGVLGGDVVNDGKHSAKGDYTIAAPVLSVNKNSVIISDPVNTAAGGSTPHAIPGAVVEYCIVVANAAGAGATASGITIGDNLPQTGSTPLVVYTGGNAIFLNASVAGTVCTGEIGRAHV